MLRVVYDHGPVNNAWEDFDTIRKRVEEAWHKVPKLHDPISKELRSKIDAWVSNHNEEMKEMYKIM